MATHGGHDSGGTMDISEQKRTWSSFTRLAAWSTGIVVAVLILMALFLL